MTARPELKQREAAIAAFDEKLEKLGYGEAKRGHHKKLQAPTPDTAKPRPKA